MKKNILNKGLIIAVGIIAIASVLIFQKENINNYLKGTFQNATNPPSFNPNISFVTPVQATVVGNAISVPISINISGVTTENIDGLNYTFIIQDDTGAPITSITMAGSCFDEGANINEGLFDWDFQFTDCPTNHVIGTEIGGTPITTNGIHAVGELNLTNVSYPSTKTSFKLYLESINPNNEMTDANNNLTIDLTSDETIVVSLGTPVTSATLTCVGGCDPDNPHIEQTLQGDYLPQAATLASVEWIVTGSCLATGTFPQPLNNPPLPYQSYIFPTNGQGLTSNHTNCFIEFKVIDTFTHPESDITANSVTIAPAIQLSPLVVNDYTPTVTMNLMNGVDPLQGSWNVMLNNISVQNIPCPSSACTCSNVPTNNTPPNNTLINQCILTNTAPPLIVPFKIGQIWTFTPTVSPNAPSSVNFTVVNTPPAVNPSPNTEFTCAPLIVNEDGLLTCNIRIDDKDNNPAQILNYNLKINTTNKFQVKRTSDSGPNDSGSESGSEERSDSITRNPGPGGFPHILTWTPKNSDVGTRTIEFSVTDTVVNGTNTTTTMTPINITVLNVNDAPIWDNATLSLNNTSSPVFQGQPFTKILKIQDDDLNVNPNEGIKYTLEVTKGGSPITTLTVCDSTLACSTTDSDVGTGISLKTNPIIGQLSTAQIDWTPSNPDAIGNPTYVFILKAEDLSGLKPNLPVIPTTLVNGAIKLNINVTNTNDAPVILTNNILLYAITNSKFSGTEDIALNIDFDTACDNTLTPLPTVELCGSDPDNDPLTWCIDGFNPGFNPVNNIPGIASIFCGATQMTITPETNFNGTAVVDLKLSDGSLSDLYTSLPIIFVNASDSLSIDSLTTSAIEPIPFQEDQTFQINLAPYALDKDISNNVRYGLLVNPTTQQQYRNSLKWQVTSNTLVTSVVDRTIQFGLSEWGKFDITPKPNQNGPIALVATLSDVAGNPPRTESQSFTVILDPVNDPVLWSITPPVVMRNDLTQPLDICWHTKAYIGHEFSFIPEDPGIVTQVDEGETLIFTVTDTITNFITNLQGKREWKFTPPITATVGTFETATFHVKDDPNAIQQDDLCAEIEIRPASEFIGGGGPCTPLLNGDFNLDCTVNSGDAVLMKYAFNSFGGQNPTTITGAHALIIYDVNASGTFDAGDVDKVTYAVFGYGGLQVNVSFPNSLGNPSN